MTSLSSLRPVQFLHSIHMRRSTMALVVFFLLTVALYLLVRPTPEHVAQTRRATQTEQSAVDGGSPENSAKPTSTRRHATATPTATATATPTPTPTPSATPDPSATATPTTPPSGSLTPTTTAGTGSDLRSDGTAATPGVTAPAPTAGLGLSGTTGQP